MKKPENLLTIPGIKSFCLGIVVSAALFLPSQASADDISLNLKNVTVKRAIAALQQSHYSLTVDASQIDMERRITVAAEDEPIENVLAQIFAGQDVSYEINGRSIVVTRRAVPRVAEKAVSRTLSGVVRDDKGATIVGATVVVKGTTTGVTTDIDGRYSLRVSADNPVLQISFVGYRTAEVAVAPAQTVVDVTLAASSIDVDEVVVVGYGTQSRHTLTTAVSKIAGSAVAAAPVTSVGDALKGKVAGMQVSTTNSLPGEAPTFLIRGGSSINQSNAPIVIVDGITRAMNDINPNDIESIEVLKDAAAAGIYGSRASNGVILITTKKGTVGKGPEIVFEGQIGWESPSRKWDFMNAEEVLSFVRPAIAESYNGASVLTSATAAGTGNGDGSIHTTRFLGDGEAVPAGWRSMTDPVTGRTIVFTDTDEQGHWFRDALWAKAYVGVTGGNENVKYAASVSYADDGGVVAMTDYSVFTMHGSADFKISKRLSASTTFDLSRSIRHPLVDNYFNSLGRGLLIAPTHRDYDADGNLLRGGDNKNCHTAMWYETYYDRECADKRATGNFNLNWEIVDGLTATAQYAMHDYNYRGSYYYKGNSLEQTRSCTETRTETLRDQFTAYLNFDRTFKRHQIGVTAGYDYMAERYRYLTANSTYAPSDKVPVLQSGGNFTASNKDTKEVLISYFGRVNYNFDKRYILSFTARADGSSKFAPGNKWGFFPAGAAAWNVSDEKFWNVRPINDLKLRVSYGMTGNNGIGLYDAYGSYSTAQNYAGHSTTIASAMANSALRWETTTQFDIGFDLGMFQNRLRIVADYYNKVTDNMIFSITLPDTSAYSSVKANVGSARFSGFELEVHSINVQKKNFTWTTDLTYTYNRNRVLSLPDEYKYTDVDGRDAWRIGGYTMTESGYRFGGTAVGEPLGRIYGYKIAGIIQSQAEADAALYDSQSHGYRRSDGFSENTDSKYKGRKDIGDYEWCNREGSARLADGREQISSEDMFYLGSVIPHSVGGINNTFKYKNLSLSVYLDYALGHSIYNYFKSRVFQNGMGSNNANLDKMVYDCWRYPGDTEAKYARFYANDPDYGNRNFSRISDFNVEKADYLCIRDVTLAYDLPVRWIKKLGMKKLTVSVTGNTLYYFTKVSGSISPESGAGADGNLYKSTSTGDATGNIAPNARKVLFSLKCVF